MELGVDDADRADDGDGDEEGVHGAPTSRKEKQQKPAANGERRGRVESPSNGNDNPNNENGCHGQAALLPGEEEEGRHDERSPKKDRLCGAGQLY